MLEDGAFMPTRAHREDAGLDLRAPYEIVVRPGGSALIDTGVHMEIPQRYFGKLESKSGLMVNHGIVCPGGVVDAGYTGSIVVCLENHGTRDYWIQRGDKIVQLVVIPCMAPPMTLVDELEETDRGDGGFGSTGR